jgi:hypothetical protein
VLRGGSKQRRASDDLSTSFSAEIRRYVRGH